MLKSIAFNLIWFDVKTTNRKSTDRAKQKNSTRIKQLHAYNPVKNVERCGDALFLKVKVQEILTQSLCFQLNRK